MKRLFAIAVAVMWVLAGCSTVGIEVAPVDQNATTIITAKMAARSLGYYMVKKVPGAKDEAMGMVSAIEAAIASGDPAASIDELVKNALAKAIQGLGNDPLLAANLADITELVRFTATVQMPDAEKLELYKKVIGAFKEGVLIAQLD